ncbi:uncharacterized protein TrAFT101_009712 [Trichoderma asperellum]|uniref:uncharacterized protein n=1 Tax=Trichoderma asperellum TaxID=101201 RepID=UPI0033308968|nr:hypothetical protein TrAFT101_009712 [Trichoderma asperellum]
MQPRYYERPDDDSICSRSSRIERSRSLRITCEMRNVGGKGFCRSQSISIVNLHFGRFTIASGSTSSSTH